MYQSGGFFYLYAHVRIYNALVQKTFPFLFPPPSKSLLIKFVLVFFARAFACSSYPFTATCRRFCTPCWCCCCYDYFSREEKRDPESDNYLYYAHMHREKENTTWCDGASSKEKRPIKMSAFPFAWLSTEWHLCVVHSRQYNVCFVLYLIDFLVHIFKASDWSKEAIRLPPPSKRVFLPS